MYHANNNLSNSSLWLQEIATSKGVLPFLSVSLLSAPTFNNALQASKCPHPTNIECCDGSYISCLYHSLTINLNIDKYEKATFNFMGM